ncbi:MAG: hypothetical protein LBU58_11455 [Clostridiales bacterium]|jgi:hypothetical protein|nr:hypothetical protein [Clostridiales bacterium]
MQHLLAARLYLAMDAQTGRPVRSPVAAWGADPRFWVGSIAPDAVSGWKEKDHSHFRDAEDRGAALAELSRATGFAEPFAEAVLLHLFVDWKWDRGPMQAFRDLRGDSDWFLPYRDEIRKLGVWLYHHTDWSHEVWDLMEQCRTCAYGRIEGATAQDIQNLVRRNRQWHIDNPLAEPGFYTPEATERFLTGVLEEYRGWRAAHSSYIKMKEERTNEEF